MKIKLYMILSSFLSIMTLSSCLDASSLMDKEDVGDLYEKDVFKDPTYACLLYTSPSPRDTERSRMPSSA